MIYTILTDAVTYASWLFVVSLGLTLVFGVLKVLNIAHGSVYALGAYAAATLVTYAVSWKLPGGFYLLAMLLAAALVAAVVGPLLERTLLARFQGRDEVLLLLVTYALFLILEDVTKLVWGVNPLFAAEPMQMFGNVSIGPIRMAGYDLMLFCLAIVCGCSTWLVLHRSTIGKMVLAVIHNPEISASMGVNVRRVYTGAFTAGMFLAALGGAFTAPLVSVQPGLSVSVIVVSFAVVIIGGLGSIQGAAIGALIVGLARAASVHLMPAVELFSVYAVMAGVLIFRPEGLFQSVKARLI
ncbi:MAG: branched-chain amino acid ABC transporter permease [Proteobacteria bacterium]|nr:branched-chain amino acid ABC transporter permease [Pseudomonadota bacterium]